jgi:acyl-coenzyme A synthetase/AMP-(fatty) acid ligase
MTPSVSPAPADEGLRRHGIGDLVSRSAARHPDKIALMFDGTRRTCRALEQPITRAANALSARHPARGVRRALLAQQRRLRHPVFRARAAGASSAAAANGGRALRRPIVILERLPKNANGKILQRELSSQDSCTRAP